MTLVVHTPEALSEPHNQHGREGPPKPTSSQRPSQAASCWLVELGNGEKFIFDIGTALPDLIEKMNLPVARALNVGTQIHTAPPVFGKVMSLVKPRLAVAYHFFNQFDTAPSILEGIRQTYDGPLSLADDMIVWNVTKDEIKVREIRFNEDIWARRCCARCPSIATS